MMKKIKKYLTLILATLCLTTCLVSCNEDKDVNVITLTDNQALLTNPDMGWNFTYYANCIYAFGDELQSGDYLDDFPCETVFFRIGWNYLEPQEGQFNWAFTDKVANEWIERGKRIAFCWAVTYPGDQSTPLWVRDAGAEGVQYSWLPDVNSDSGELHLTPAEYPERTGSMSWSTTPRDAKEYALNKGIQYDPNYNGGQEVEEGDYEKYRGSWVPYYDDPIFLEKWENFLKAAAERYDNNPAVEFIEIGSFGDWGEGHYTCTKQNPVTTAIKTTHINLYAKYFKNVQLMINDDVVGTSSLVDYTKSLGIGISDHSVQVPSAGYENGRYGNREVTMQYYDELPVLLENHNGTIFTETYFDSVNNCHATYARINCNPYTTKRSEWTDKITRRLGYRLTFTEVSFDNLVAGKEVEINFKIKNTGAAICYGGGTPTFYIVDSLGRVKASATSTFDVRDLPVASSAEKAEVKEGKVTLKMPSALLADEYYLVVSVTKDGEDYYNLPLDHQDGTKRRYRIATFTVE